MDIITSVYYFIAARIILGIGEAGNFPAAIKAVMCGFLSGGPLRFLAEGAVLCPVKTGISARIVIK